MNTLRNRQISSVIKFITICLAIMIFGFFVVSKNVVPTKSQDLLQTDYTSIIDHKLTALNNDMLMINEVVSETLENRDFNSLNSKLDIYKNLNPLIENIHIQMGEYSIYDGDKQPSSAINAEDWLNFASAEGHISTPYLDPISQEDIITISYLIGENSKNVIAYKTLLHMILSYKT